MNDTTSLAAQIQHWGHWIGLPAEACNAFAQAVQPAELETYAQIRSGLMKGEDAKADPVPKAIAAISAIPLMLENHHKRGVSEAISRATASDIALWIKEYHRKSGSWGLSNTGWTRNHLSGRLHRLGRLQFIPTPCKMSGLRPEDTVKNGDPILEVHIPAGEPLLPDACLESFEAAKQFYADMRSVGFTCVSWLLGPNLEEVLPPDSNVIQFKRMFQQVPCGSSDQQMCERVFDMFPLDLEKAPQQTSMQRAILAYYKNGGKIPAGAGFRAISQ